MDTSRISFGEMVAGVSGLVLLVVMFFPWFGVKASVAGFGDVEGTSFSAWESFGFIDVLLLLVVLIAVGIAAARAAGSMPANLPAPPGLIVTGAGALAVLLILFRLIDTPGEDISGVGAQVDITRKIGIFLGLIAAGGITFGGYTAMNERATGEAPRTTGEAPRATGEAPPE